MRKVEELVSLLTQSDIKYFLLLLLLLARSRLRLNKIIIDKNVFTAGINMIKGSDLV